MATDNAPTRDIVRRTRSRREPAPLEQLPVWDGFIADAPAVIDGDPPAGLDALLGGLNPEQLRAVTHGVGPLLVVAGAGTGKTQVITRRIAWLIATRRARPSEILALTFTEKAAAEMQVRVDQLVPYGYTDAAIGTFHAFGDRIIREYALELGLPTDVRVLTRPEVVIFLREHLFEFELDLYRPLGDPTRFLGALATLFSRCKDEDIAPDAYLAHADQLAVRAAAAPDDEALAEEARRQAELARAYARYQELLAANGFIDFGDQVNLALRLVRTSAAARLELQSRFRFVLVDEFQDTNRAQSELVSILAEPHRNVTVVGDDDQSIYKFRGAAISNILGFRDRYPDARTVVLRRNYRSLAPILDASYRLVRFNDPDRLEVRAGISKRLRAERRTEPDAPAVRLEAFATHAEEADWIAAEIAARIEAGARPRDVAVLVRANGHADPILRSLNVAGVPWRFSGTSGLYARPEVRQLLAFLRAVADLSSSVDVYALATSEPYGLGGEDMTAIVNTARRRHRSIWDILDELERQPGILRLSPATRTAASRLVADLRRFTELAHQRPAGEVLYRFLRDSGTLARLAASDTVAAEEALRNIARFFDIVRAQSALLSDDRATFVVRHLQTLIEAGDDPPTADLDPDADAVAVLTVHKAKGLEFPVVFMPGLVAGRFPTHTQARAARSAAGAGEGNPARRRLPAPGGAPPLLRRHDPGARRADPVARGGLRRWRGPPPVTVRPGGARSPDRRRRPGNGCHDGAGPGTPRGIRPAVTRPGPPARPDRRAAPPELLRRRRLPHVPAQVQVRPRAAGAARPASRADLRLGAPQGGPGVPSAPRQGRRDDRGRVDGRLRAAWTNEGFLTRDHEEARLAAGRDALRRFREQQLRPDAVIPAYVERDFSFTLDGDRVRGRWDRVDIEPAADGTDTEPADAAAPHADTVSPTLGLTGRERVTITDYKASDVRDPVKARQRARESLQLQIYAMGYEALTGRLPDYLQLHFLDSGLVGRVEVDPKRLAKARQKIAVAAAGMRARDYTAKPDRMACSYCPFREICPSSVAT